MNDKIVYALVGAVSVLAIFAIYQTYQLNAARAGAPTGAVTGAVIAAGHTINDVPTGDTFTGKITNAKVTPGKVLGNGVYDRSCNMVGGGLTNCDGGIQTKEYGTLNFNYQHNMQQEPCIAPGDAVLVTILDSSGSATVQRFN